MGKGAGRVFSVHLWPRLPTGRLSDAMVDGKPPTPSCVVSPSQGSKVYLLLWWPPSILLPRVSLHTKPSFGLSRGPSSCSSKKQAQGFFKGLLLILCSVSQSPIQTKPSFGWEPLWFGFPLSSSGQVHRDPCPLPGSQGPFTHSGLSPNIQARSSLSVIPGASVVSIQPHLSL